MISSQINNKQHQKFKCDRCLKFSNTEEKFKQHIVFCDYYLEHEKADLVLPEKGKNILEFKNLQNKIQVPLIYYTDFESVIKNLPNEKSKHEMCSYSFFALGKNEFYKNFKIYTGNSANDAIGFGTVYRQTVYRHPVYRQPVYRHDRFIDTQFIDRPFYRHPVYRQTVLSTASLSTRRLIEKSILST